MNAPVPPSAPACKQNFEESKQLFTSLDPMLNPPLDVSELSVLSGIVFLDRVLNQMQQTLCFPCDSR